MRILMTTTRGAGHLGPMLPFAHAFRRAGDDVRFAAVPSAAPMLEAEGFAAYPLDEPPERERDAVFAAGVLAAIDAYRPDVIVHAVCELAAGLAADGVASVR